MHSYIAGLLNDIEASSLTSLIEAGLIAPASAPLFAATAAHAGYAVKHGVYRFSAHYQGRAAAASTRVRKSEKNHLGRDRFGVRRHAKIRFFVLA
jgi:hypothetical protein